jgi:hypothetical protein
MPVMGGETQAGLVGVRGAGHLWRSGRYQAERQHRGHGGDDGEHGEGVGEPLERRYGVRPAAATVEATATQSSEAVSWAWLDLNPGTSS